MPSTDRHYLAESSRELCERGSVTNPFYRWVHFSLSEAKTYVPTTVLNCLLGESWMIAVTTFQRDRLFIMENVKHLQRYREHSLKPCDPLSQFQQFPAHGRSRFTHSSTHSRWALDSFEASPRHSVI